jgi:AcrR family transcriptional regulator
VAKRTARSRPINSPARSNGSVRAEDVHDAALTLFATRGYHGTSMEDIAAALGLRAPSLYNHVESKQSLLQQIMLGTVESLVRDQQAVLATTQDVTEQLRRAMEAHVRFHTRFQREVRVSNNEIASIEEPARSRLLELRRQYARPWIELIERGVAEGRFESQWPRLTAFALIEMGMGVSLWFRADGPLSESQVVYYYGDMALRLVLPGTYRDRQAPGGWESPPERLRDAPDGEPLRHADAVASPARRRR